MRPAGGTTGVLYDALNFVKLSLKLVKLTVWYDMVTSGHLLNLTMVLE